MLETFKCMHLTSNLMHLYFKFKPMTKFLKPTRFSIIKSN